VALRRETVLAFLGVTLAGMALAGLIAWALARNVLRPIRRLVAASKEISAGNFEHHVPEASRDEFGSLERAFNRMTEAIRERDREIREAAELRLVRSAALASLGRLAASVAHEVNNPLAGILVYLRLMLKYMTRTPFPAERVEEMVSWLKAMESETARCGRLVQGMLQLGREPPMKLSDHDLNAIAEKSIVLLERRFALGNVKVERKFDAALPAVQCDGEQIQQTIMGLVLNAFEAMPRGGTVTIATRRQPDGDGVQIRVADEGIGIPPENLPRLFDAFFTTKGDGKGVGLGLSIAHAIVRRHQGRIDVESEVGRGTTFTVTLPLRQGPRADAAPREADGKERGSRDG
jgi:two-component system NtrC family sensor kinase